MSEETILRPEQNYGPGNVLRAKREEYEWSVDAVAEALHLSTTSVKAIEADRYEDLPGATYVMGYWRSYARLLGIDIEDTIEANKQNLNIVTAEASGMDVHRAFSHKKRDGSGSGGWLLFLIAAAIFAYCFRCANSLDKNDGIIAGDVATLPPAPPDLSGITIGTEDHPIKVLFVPSVDVDFMIAGGELIEQALLTATGLYVDVSVPTSYAATIEEMCASPTDTIGFIPAMGYALANELCGVEPALASVRYGWNVYWAQFIVRRDSGIETIADLEGKSWAYPYPSSTSGYLYPTALFAEMGITVGETDVPPHRWVA